MDWDPEIDTPANVLIIGAGPTGIEAALYARFLGYSVLVVDSTRVGGRLARWGSAPLLDAPSEAMSPLGRAALEAQGVAVPAEADVQTCVEFVQNYLIPVAKTDLLYESIQINSELLSLSRTGAHSQAALSLEQASELEFRALIRSNKRGEYSQVFDLVLDCSGTGNRTGLASGQGLAKGETELLTLTEKAKRELEYWDGPVAVESVDFAGKHVVVFGDDSAARHNVAQLADLAKSESTKVTWLQPKYYGDSALVGEREEALLSEAGEAWLRQLSELDSRLEMEPIPGVAVQDCWGVESITKQEAGGWVVSFQSKPEESLDCSVDCFINCNAPRADFGWSHELNPAANSEQPTGIKGQIVRREPHWYVLGQKSQSVSESAGNERSWLSLSNIHDQIKAAFGMIGGRGELDLYKMVREQKTE